MRLAAGAGREAQERTLIVQDQFYNLAPIEQTPLISWASNELGSESRAEVNVGTGTGIRHLL